MIFSLNSSRFLIFSSCFGTRDARHLSALMMPDSVSFLDSVFDSFFNSSSVKFSMNWETMSYHNTNWTEWTRKMMEMPHLKQFTSGFKSIYTVLIISETFVTNTITSHLCLKSQFFHTYFRLYRFSQHWFLEIVAAVFTQAGFLETKKLVAGTKIKKRNCHPTSTRLSTACQKGHNWRFKMFFDSAFAKLKNPVDCHLKSDTKMKNAILLKEIIAQWYTTESMQAKIYTTYLVQLYRYRLKKEQKHKVKLVRLFLTCEIIQINVRDLQWLVWSISGL